MQPASNPETDPVRNLRVHGTRLIASGNGNSNFAIYVAHPVESMTARCGLRHNMHPACLS